MGEADGSHPGYDSVFLAGSLDPGPDLTRGFLDPFSLDKRTEEIVIARERTEALSAAIASIIEPLGPAMYVAAHQGQSTAVESRRRRLRKGKSKEWVKSWEVYSTYPVPQARTENNWKCFGDLEVQTSFHLRFRTKNQGSGEEMNQVDRLVAINEVVAEGGDSPRGVTNLYNLELVVKNRRIEAVGLVLGYDGRLARIFSEVSPAYKKLFDLRRRNEHEDPAPLKFDADLRFVFGQDFPSLEVGNNERKFWILDDNKPHPDKFIIDPESNQFVFQPKEIGGRIRPYPNFLALRRIPSDYYMELLTAVVELIPTQFK